MQIADTLEFLAGSWHVSRSIADHRSHASGSFEGQALFTLLPGDRSGASRRGRYEETGELRFGSYRGAARRSLQYLQREDGSLVLYRPSGEVLMDLDLSSGLWRSTHLCGGDRYEISTAVQSPEVVQELWRVEGPSKDYLAATTLRRAGLV